MLLQKDEFSCGVFAVANALRCFGINAKEFEVRRYSNTTKNGTDENGVLRALEHFGLSPLPFTFTNKKEAIKYLRSSLKVGFPAIICVNNWKHWSLANGILGERFVITDSSNSKRNQRELGCRVIDEKTLLKLWSCNSGEFYGIICCRSK